MDDYFSDRELGSRPRNKEDISEVAWGGIVAIINALIINGGFGREFPEECPDGNVVIGTNNNSFADAVRGEIPDINWPLDASTPPPTLAVLDLLEFCHRSVANSIQQNYHSHFRHYHLEFDRESGQCDFRKKISRILARNGIAFGLNEDGRVERLAPPVLREELAEALFETGDDTLNNMLEIARKKFLNPDPVIRREALEKLWDAWERLKTLELGKNKRNSIATILDKAAPEPNFRYQLDKEAKKLTEIGNSFQIRHSETTQTPLSSDHDVDYLFHRLFAFIQRLLRV